MHRHTYQLISNHHSSNAGGSGGGWSSTTWLALGLFAVAAASFVFFMTSPLLPWGKHGDLDTRLSALETVVQMINGTKRRSAAAAAARDMPPVIETYDTHAYINAAGIYIDGEPFKFSDLYDVKQSPPTGPMVMWEDNELVSANMTTDQIPQGELNKYLLPGSVSATHFSSALLASIAPLDGNGHVPLQHLPLGTVATVQVVPTLVERDALLNVNPGDVAVVLNVNGTGHRESFIWNSTAWVQLSDHDSVAAAAAHVAITSGNPHGVTKADVGLGNVLNTKNDLAALSAPSAFLDVSSGFTPGSLVVVPAGAGSVWHATDTTIGLAKWKRMDGMLPPTQSAVVSDSIARFDGTTGLLLKDSAVTIQIVETLCSTV